MDNHKSLINWLFTSLIAIVSFFLLMFYKKVDKMSDDINSMVITNAVKEIQINGLSERITNLEKAVYELTQQAKKISYEETTRK